MKYLILILTFWCQCSLQAQNIEPAPADKAVVYFVRMTETGSLINFTYFDSNVVIGECNDSEYLRHECNPGKHLFWVQAENRDFMKAHLKAGNIYVVGVYSHIGYTQIKTALMPFNSPVFRSDAWRVRTDRRRDDRVFHAAGRRLLPLWRLETDCSGITVTGRCKVHRRSCL